VLIKGLRLEQADFRKIISGQKNGIAAELLRQLLRLLSVPYIAAIRLRNLLYDRQIFKSYRADITVISIGNITTGGTGKTPVVAWLTNKICEKYKCAILTRGYKSTIKGSDEANILARTCPNIPIIINPDRVKGANEAVKIHDAEVLIMDDGFQHRRLTRDIDIVTIDATCPFGYGRILPAGLLREPVNSVKRADAVIITRTDQTDSDLLERIEKKLLSANRSLVIAHSVHKPRCIITAAGNELQPEQLRGKQVFAFCAVGNPESFFNTIRSGGAEIIETGIYNDHYSYSKDDIDVLESRALAANTSLILGTEKDFSKIEPEWLKGSKVDFAYLTVGIEIIKGAEKITELIEKALAVKITDNN